ncbi:MAG: PEGA domain-containing protein [Candidatus Omnitrophica bacterium]|nr:PEGA domain-containing protein [Candidatus Omnitrophota bacterium]
MLYFRKIVLLSLTAIYIILCPLLISYAFGRILRPGAASDSAGLIFLSTNPPGARIYIEGRLFSERTPAALKGMLAGTYEVEVSLKGYKPWQTTIRAFPKLASVFDKILLVPDNWKTKELAYEPFRQLVSLSESRFFILNKGSRLGDYYSFDSEDEETTPFVRAGSSLAQFEVVSLYQVAGSSRVVLQARDSREEKYFLIDQEKGYVDVKDISRFFPAKFEHILWDPELPDYLFTFKEGGLSRIDLSGYSQGENYLQGLKGYGLFGQVIYVLKDINTLLRLDYERGNQRVVFDDPILGNFLFGREDFFQVKPLDSQIIFFIGTKGRLVSNLAPNRWVEEGLRGLEFHRQTKRALFWIKDLAAIIDYRPLFLAQPTTIKSTLPDRYSFYSKGRNITQGFWAYQGAYVVLADSDKVSLFELKDQTESFPNEIVKISSGSSVHYYEPSGKLYYLVPQSNKLNCLEIVPGVSKQPLSFREYLSGKPR